MDKDKLKIEENEHGQKQENYMALGMCFGVMAGSVAMAILAMFGQIAWGGMCIGLGLILGMLIGMAIPKKKQTNFSLAKRLKATENLNLWGT